MFKWNFFCLSVLVASCPAGAQAQQAWGLLLAQLPAPCLQPGHWTFSTAANLQAEQVPFAWRQKSEAWRLHPHGGLWHQWLCLTLSSYSWSSGFCSYEVLEKISSNSFSCLCRWHRSSISRDILQPRTPSPPVPASVKHPCTHRPAELHPPSGAQVELMPEEVALVAAPWQVTVTTWAHVHHLPQSFWPTSVHPSAQTGTDRCMSWSPLSAVTHLCHTSVSQRYA